MNTHKLTLFLDASSLKTSKCIRRLLYTIHNGYTSLAKNHVMEYGTAGHLFIAHWYKTKDIKASLTLALESYLDPAIEIPEKDWRTPAHLCQTLNSYATTFEQDSFEPCQDIDGNLLVEQRFAIPFYEDDYLRVILFGVVDALGTYGREYIFLDHKFTAVYDIEGYFKSFELSVQMLTYRYGISYLAAKHPDTFGMFRRAKCVVDGIFINKSGARFDRSHLIDIPDERVTEYKWLVQRQCRRISEALRSGEIPKEGMINSACDGEYGRPCPFASACLSDMPEDILDMNFRKRSYDPTIFDD